MYTVSTLPESADPRELAQFFMQELEEISGVFTRLQGGELLEKVHKEPAKLRDGLVVLADGTDWNPGSGAGAYCYYGAAWHFLG
jgi:hypothetical protein